MAGETIVDRGAPGLSPGRLAWLLSLAALPFVALRAFSGMQWFDDEGLFLSAFHAYRHGYRMFDDIFTFYGPLYYAAYIFYYSVLDVPIAHVSARLALVVLWLGLGAGFGLLGFRLTGWRPVQVACQVLTVLWLARMANSAGHPETLCLVLMAVALVLACDAGERSRAAVLLAVGAAVAGLLLIKVNFAACVGGGILFALLRAGPPAWWVRAGAVATAAALLGLPLAVTAFQMDRGWVPPVWFTTTAAVAAALVAQQGMAVRAGAGAGSGARSLLLVVAGGVAAMVAVVLAMLAAGSSLHAVTLGSLARNLHFARNWNVPIEMGWHGMLAAAVSVALAVAWRVGRARAGLEVRAAQMVLVLKAGFVVLGLLLFAWPGMFYRALAPFCWLVLVAPGAGAGAVSQGRLAVAMAGAAMALYVFPVAGHQVEIAALVPVVLLPVLAHDVAASLRPFAVARRAGVLVAGACVAWLGVATALAARGYAALVPVGLPGTAFIRAEPGIVAEFRWAVQALAACPATYTVPGIHGFVLWVPGELVSPVMPNGMFTQLTAAEQERMIAQWERHPGLCILFDPRAVAFWDRGQVAKGAPLYEHFRGRFEKVAQGAAFEIHRRRGE